MQSETTTARLAALRATGLLDSPRERRFDRLTRITAAALGVPVSLIALVDDGRQFFKSQTGLAAPWAERRETPLSHSFCRHVVESRAPLVVDDSTENALVRDNPAVTELDVKAYLGVPIADRAGIVIGSLCAINPSPRRWSFDDLVILTDVAALVQREIADRDTLTALQESERLWRSILNALPDMVFATTPEGAPDGFNRAWHDFTGTPEAEGGASERPWLDHVFSEDRTATEARWQICLSSETVFEAVFRLGHHTGEYRTVLARAVPVRGAEGALERWLGTCTDIQAVKDLDSAGEQQKQAALHAAISRLADRAAYAPGRQEFDELRGIITVLRSIA